jgi:hypothetical protein
MSELELERCEGWSQRRKKETPGEKEEEAKAVHVTRLEDGERMANRQMKQGSPGLAS